MLQQLESELAQVQGPARVGALALLALLLLALWAHRRRQARKTAPLLSAKTEKKRPRFIRTSHKREKDPKRRRAIIGFAGMALVVLLGFGLSANTSIVFAEARLHLQHPWTLTVGLALEGIVLGLTLYSWAFEDKSTARAAYLLVLAQAIGAVEVVRFQNEDLGTAAVRIVGPVMLAYGLHKMLGLETKLKKIEVRSDGMLARTWRHFLKWLESYLGISEREADAEAIRRKRAQDKLVELATLGKPRFMREQKYHRLLMEMGDLSFAGLTNPLDELEVETRITTRKDRAEAFRRLPDRAERYDLHSLRPSRGQQGAPGPDRDIDTALTSEGAAGRATGHTEGAPKATPVEAQARTGRVEDDPNLVKLAFELYCDLRDTAGKPSQNAFEKAWRERQYGLKTDDVRALYRRINSKMSGS